MKSLAVLIKLAQRQVDEHRDELARILRARAAADAALAAHDGVAATEAAAAKANPETLDSFTTWMKHAARLRALLRERRDTLECTEAAAREALRDAVAQLKRLETAVGTARAAERRVTGRREEIRADDQERSRAAV